MKYGVQDKNGYRYGGRNSSLERTQKLIVWLDNNQPAVAPFLIVEYAE